MKRRYLYAFQSVAVGLLDAVVDGAPGTVEFRRHCEARRLAHILPSPSAPLLECATPERGTLDAVAVVVAAYGAAVLRSCQGFRVITAVHSRTECVKPVKPDGVLGGQLA